ncbi:MAG: anhydro-N-acetylmuramic acid kinase [Alphaproteobacteria bacterium]
MAESFEPVLALGLMSGTSMDGIDAALLETDGEAVIRAGARLSLPYDAAFRSLLVETAAGRADPFATERALTDRHAEAVRALLRAAGLGPAAVRVIGFHGHTIRHEPAAGLTVQLGDGARLCALTGIDVVADFRRRDLAAGGEGAPLAPVFHAALARCEPRPLAVLNLGGVGNLTFVPAGEAPEAGLIAFDTGPGCALIDDWALCHLGQPLDRDGGLARRGRVDREALQALLAAPYFGRPPPKSLDRADLGAAPVEALSAEDGAATLVAFTAAAVARALRHLPAPPLRWLVTGGGRRNPALMAALAESLAAPVDPIEAIGADGDALEAQAFAYLAVRSLRGLALSFPGTTGVPAPLTGGALHRVGARRPSP